MKWKPNRRQQFIAGEAGHALPLLSFSLALTSWQLIGRLRVFHLTDAWMYDVYINKHRQRDGDMHRPMYALYIDPDRDSHRDVYYLNSNSHSLSYSSSRSLSLTIFKSKPLQISFAGLWAHAVKFQCLPEEMSQESTAKNNTETTLYTQGSALSANPGLGSTLRWQH